MKMQLAGLLFLTFVCYSSAQIDPPENARRKSWWVETHFSEPDVMIVHRNNRQMKIRRVPGSGEEGTPLVLEGPSEISMKWVDGPVPWPDEITVISEEQMHDGVVLVQVDGDAGAAAATLALMPEVLYAYPVEYTDPMFARIMPTDQIIAQLNGGVVLGQITVPFGLESVTNMIGSETEFVLRLVDPKATATSNIVAALQTSGLVAWAQRDCLREGEFYAAPNDTQFGNQWHMNATGQSIGGVTAPNNVDVDAPNAWNTTTGGGSIIAVVDDAIETTHPDLTANITATPLAAIDVFYPNDYNPNPDLTTDGHGTSCAGIAAAVGNNMLGVAGISYSSTIVPVKICGKGVFPNDSTVANGVRHAADYADIITCSWGYYDPSPSTLSAVQYALQSGAGGRGSVVYFATGNDGGFISSSVTLAPSTTYNLRWTYNKDAANSFGLDKCFVDSIWYPDFATSEMFDGVMPTALPGGWTSGGAGSWISAAQSAGNRAESGSGGVWQFIESPPITHNQTAWAQVQSTTHATYPTLWYYMRVSAEPTVYGATSTKMPDYGQLEYQIAGSPPGTPWTKVNPQGGQPAALSYPAQYPETVAVGANDWTSRRSHYSQWSGELDFVAPSDGDWAGLGIETTDMTGTGGYDTGNYCQASSTSSKFGGTSAAAPLAAGIGALVRSANPALSPAQVRNVMRASCRKIDPSWYSYSGFLGGKDQYVGWGQVDADGALAAAAVEPPVGQIAFDLKITEVSPIDADCPFVEIFNSSMANGYLLETLMLTDCETGGDQLESSFMFPQGLAVPPQGVLVVALGSATSGLINDLNTVMAVGAAPAGGIQLFECVPSGLTFNGLTVWPMLPQVVMPGIMLNASDNIALVVTPGMQASYLPDVVDGMAFGMPSITGGCIIGAGPSIPAPPTYPFGANGTKSYQRNGVVDTENSLADFMAAPRTPGRIVYGMPVASASALALTSYANELEVMPGLSTPIVAIAASLDPLFDPPANGVPLPPGSPFGTDVIIYNGPVGPGMPGADIGFPPVAPYASGTPVYYRVWSVSPGDLYSAGTDFTATTLPPPVALPFADQFNAGLFANPNLWPYVFGAWIDSGCMVYAGPPPSPFDCLYLDNSAGPNPRIDSINIDASTTPNVKVTYWLAETGFGPGDLLEPWDSLDVQLLDPTLNWVTIFTHPAMGPMPFMPFEHPIDPAMLHPDLRVRFVSQAQIDYLGDLDNWFIDDVTVEEFPVLSGFLWQPISPANISAGIPFAAQVTALSSMGGALTDYGGTPGITLYATNGSPSSALSPDPLTGFASGIWSGNITIDDEDAEPVVLVADDGGVSGTSSVFRVFNDLDNDLMLDLWEFGWFGSINVASNSPATDWDNDLFPDYSEFIAGTIPTNPASYLYLYIPIIDLGVSNVVAWPSVSNRVYDIWRNTNLNSSSWVMVSVSNLPALPPTNFWTDTSSPSNRAFYKVKVKQKK